MVNCRYARSLGLRLSLQNVLNTEYMVGVRGLDRVEDEEEKPLCLLEENISVDI